MLVKDQMASIPEYVFNRRKRGEIAEMDILLVLCLP